MPGGEVTISILSDPDNPYSEVKDTRRKTIETFRIARYPITVTQYRAFIKAQDGWRDPAWWGDDLYRDPEGDTYEFGRFGNHPVIYVSWFDAVAFCPLVQPAARFHCASAGRMGMAAGVDWRR